ncbi:MAG: hypothetical protein CMO55_19635 [Verrucomicrobiales bacterium]|nr:hypothetical protein [Verrucomicrobiales bacterium]
MIATVANIVYAVAMRILLSTLVLSLSLHIGFSEEFQKQEPTPETSAAAESLIETMKMGEMFEDSLSGAYETQMGQFAKMGMSPEGISKLKAEMLEFTLEIMPWSEMKPEMVRIYASYFTAEELNALDEFYKTPTGQKASRLMPELMAEGMRLGQQRVESRMGELQQRIAPIIEEELSKKAQQ